MCTHVGRLFLGSLTYEVTRFFILFHRTCECVSGLSTPKLTSSHPKALSSSICEGQTHPITDNTHRLVFFQKENLQCNGTTWAKKSWNVIYFQVRAQKIGKHKSISCTITNHLLTPVQRGSFSGTHYCVIDFFRNCRKQKVVNFQ